MYRELEAFNIPSHSNLRHCEQNKVPVQLNNLIIKEDSNIIAFSISNLWSIRLHLLMFAFNIVSSQSLRALAVEEASTVTVSDISELKANQKVTVTAVVTVCTEKPVEVFVKSTGKT